MCVGPLHQVAQQAGGTLVQVFQFLHMFLQCRNSNIGRHLAAARLVVGSGGNDVGKCVGDFVGTSRVILHCWSVVRWAIHFIKIQHSPLRFPCAFSDTCRRRAFADAGDDGRGTGASSDLLSLTGTTAALAAVAMASARASANASTPAGLSSIAGVS